MKIYVNYDERFATRDFDKAVKKFLEMFYDMLDYAMCREIVDEGAEELAPDQVDECKEFILGEMEDQFYGWDVLDEV